MPVSEPTTLASDWLLAAVAIALGLRLYRAGAGVEQWAPRLWAAAFLVGAVGALAGGAVHGFAASLPPVAHTALWKTALVASGLAGSLLLAGTVLATLARTWRRAVLAGVAGQLAGYLALVSCGSDMRHAVWNGVMTILVILALALRTASRDPRRFAWLLLALGLSAAGLAAQRARLAMGVLNHNDVCHVFQIASLGPFYRAGLRLRD